MSDKLANGSIVKPDAYPLIGGGDCVFPLTDHLATLLAAEEHRQGAPYLADPGHCQECAEVDLAWAQAVCGHDDWLERPGFGRELVERLCQVCGRVWEVAG